MVNLDAEIYEHLNKQIKINSVIYRPAMIVILFCVMNNML